MELKKLGRFEVIEEIGSGGMGLVYKGLDPRINRLVALKVIRPTLSGKPSAEQKKIADRFYVEARAAGSLSHPNIVTIYDVSEENSDRGYLVYIAMEFLEGKGLDWHIANSKDWTFLKKVRIVRDIAMGLDYAHKRGVIHRDIKPANIIMTEDGTNPIITDFGLARLTDSSLSVSGSILGTPNYMAPEQVQGKTVDARSDLFSLNVVLYEMLTGEKPFASDSLTSVIYRVVNEDPVPPRRINGDLPVVADNFIKKGLMKNPERRFSSGEEYIRALNTLLEGQTEDLGNFGDTTLVMNGDEFDEALVNGSAKTTLSSPISERGIGVIFGSLIVSAAFIIILFIYLGDNNEVKPEVTKPITKPIVKKPDSKSAKKPTVIDITPDKSPANDTVPVKETPKPKPVKPPTNAAAKAFLTITSEPSEADVFLDEKFLGQTPVNNYRVNGGTYHLVLKKKGYKSYSSNIFFRKALTKKVSLKEGSESQKAVKPKKMYGFIRVSVPAGSLVVVDGREYRKQKFTVKVAPGSHLVYLQPKGQTPQTKRISIEAGETITLP